jgi:hypothetical protein
MQVCRDSCWTLFCSVLRGPCTVHCTVVGSPVQSAYVAGRPLPLKFHCKLCSITTCQETLGEHKDTTFVMLGGGIQLTANIIVLILGAAKCQHATLHCSII